MKCENCHKNAATFHYVERQGDHIVKDIHLCQECTQVKGIHPMQFSLNTVLGQLLDPQGGGPLKVGREMADVRCPKCGMTYAEFRQKTRLGCAHDYEVFGKALVPLLEKIHGSTRHAGKVPPQGGAVLGRQKEMIDLRREIDRLVREEDYEGAAKLRDRIRQLETDAPPGDPGKP